MALTLGYEQFVRESTDANGNTVLVGGGNTYAAIPVDSAGTTMVEVPGINASFMEIL